MTLAYSTHRPVSIGTYPTGYAIDHLENYPERTWVEEIHGYAWGYIQYEDDVPEDVLERYDMVSAEHSKALDGMARKVAKAYQAAERKGWDERSSARYEKLYDKGEEEFGFDAWDRTLAREVKALGCDW